MPGRRRLLVVSNRAPVTYASDGEGGHLVRRGAGGLVTALAPLVARHDVTWVAAAMTDEERALAAAGAFEERGPGGSSYRLRLVSVEPETYRRFYDVMANRALWFVQHGLWDLVLEPDADLTVPWEAYRAVNEAFAATVVEELAGAPETAVLFQDYHLYLAPSLVRARLRHVAISQFVHIPWVGPDAWRVLPEPLVREIHAGLAACDVVGFHSTRWRDAFASSLRAYAAGSRAAPVLHVNPISVDAAEFEALAESEAVAARRRELLAARPELLVLRVDRTDPAKNAVRGFEALDLLLDRRPDLRGRVALLALLHPSRLAIPEYAAYAAAAEQAAAAVNRRFGTDSWQPVTIDLRDDFPLSVAAYGEFDVLLVNSVKDGLNLVAKEGPLVNRHDGVVVLSREAGAFDELADWVVPCDPLDVEQQSRALEEALDMPLAARRERLRAICRQVRSHDLDSWASAQLAALDRASTMRA
jgi:trehalose 6-phosphate synthase